MTDEFYWLEQRLADMAFAIQERKEKLKMPTIMEQYVEAFQRCYPQHQVQLKFKRVSPGEYRWRVIINGDPGPGEALYTEDDLRFAIRGFNRGREPAAS